MSTLHTFEGRELVEFLLMGQKRKTATVTGEAEPMTLLVQDDGRLWTYSELVGRDTNNNPVSALFELTGEQKNVLHGKDASSNIDALLTDDLKKLWIRSTFTAHESWASGSLDPVTLSNSSATTIYTGSSGYEAWVEVELSVIDGDTTRTVDLFCDPTGTDASGAFQILNDGPVPLPTTDNPTPVRLGPYNVGPGGTIKGQASAASAINARAYVIRLEKLT